MNRQPIICILGNSVPLLIQPFRHRPDEKTYSEHLFDKGYTIVNSSKQSVILSDLYYYLEDECIRHFPDFVIFHFGIVECTYRVRPRWLQNFFSMNAWNNSIIKKGYNGPITRGLKYVLKRLYKRLIERPFFKIGLKHRWLEPSNFKFIIKDISKRIFSDTPTKKIIMIGMLPISDFIEQQAPGTQSSIREYNSIFESLANEYPNIIYLDPQRITSNNPGIVISQDGIHYTAKGHELLAKELTKLLQGERINYIGWQHINQYEGLYKIYENWYKRKTSRSE